MPESFTIPIEAWNALNTLGLVAIGFIAYLRSRNTDSKIQEVKEIVDGPLSAALRDNLALALRIADLTGKADDAEAAKKAGDVVRGREASRAEQSKQSS